MMSKVLVDRNIATYTLDNNLTKISANSFSSSVNITFTNVKNLKIKALLFSLRFIKVYQDEALKTLALKLHKLRESLKIFVGFSDYSEEVYKKLRAIIKKENLEVGLYDNKVTTLFFLDKLPLNKGDKVLIHVEDKEDKESLLAEIISRGYLSISAPTMDAFNQKLKVKSSYALAIKNTFHPFALNKDSLGTEKIKEASIEHGKKVTKELIRELPVFISATIETFESMIGITTHKKNSKIVQFELTDNSLLASFINFEGKLNGFIVIIFPLSFAKKAYEALFFEDTDDMDEIKDANKEFANVIAGRAKALLEERDIHVNISLPKAYLSLDGIMGDVRGKHGAQVEFSTDDGESLYIFLSR
jgi:CheY-specific phosphatase CheX